MNTAAKNILIIDDDITSLDIVSFLIEENGYNVTRCTDGRSAIEYVKSTKPDLIIVDLMMPFLNGTETVKQIRQLERGNAPIIVFTAIDDSSMHADALAAGCDKVLTKPCNSKKLIEIIQYFLIKTSTPHC
ncbi:MAG: response regulator [Deltaproteobacteria bacterium]|nr:response regulator [Deltaproteobacteria bacterium]